MGKRHDEPPTSSCCPCGLGTPRKRRRCDAAGKDAGGRAQEASGQEGCPEEARGEEGGSQEGCQKPPKPRLVITVNKASQKLTVSLDGDTLYRWPISTGARGYDTPSGKYRPFRMEKDHFSNEWDDAPMPHSIFFTDRGHALHGSYHIKSLGRRASHGCVRIHPDNAAKLFALVGKTGMSNTQIVVTGGFFGGGATSSTGSQKSIFKSLFD